MGNDINHLNHITSTLASIAGFVSGFLSISVLVKLIVEQPHLNGLQRINQQLQRALAVTAIGLLFGAILALFTSLDIVVQPWILDIKNIIVKLGVSWIMYVLLFPPQDK